MNSSFPFIQNFNDGIELENLRRNCFYKAIRAEAEKIRDSYQFLKNRIVYDNIEDKLSLQDRVVVKFDLLFSNFFENVKERRYIRYKIENIMKFDRVTILMLTSEYRNYLNNCVILYERLAQLLTFIEYVYKTENISVDSEVKRLHEFFNPVVILQRNYNTHQSYFSTSDTVELEKFEGEIHDMLFQGQDAEKDIKKYLNQYETIIKEKISWIKMTENAFSEFLENFLNGVFSLISSNNKLKIPINIPFEFKLSKEFKIKYRQKIDHEGIFNKANIRTQK